MPPPHRNLGELLRHSVERFDSAPAYRWRNEGGGIETKNWREVWADVAEVARGMLVAGLRQGDQVGIIGSTSYRWILVDLAAVRIGACTVGLHATSPVTEQLHLIEHADCRAVFVEEAALALHLGTHGPPGLQSVVDWGRESSGERERGRNVIAWATFLARAEEVSESELEAVAQGVEESTRAAIVYTSGTTGVPRGAILTHGNLVFTAGAAAACVSTGPGDETLLFLPLAHVFARLCVYFCIWRGVATSFASAPDRFLEDARWARPHWFVAVPRVFERISAAARARIAAAPPWRRALVRWASGVGRERTERIEAKRAIGPWLFLRAAVADGLVFRRLRNLFGGRLRFCISGSAPLDAELARFFHDARVVILEGIGMTENTSLTHVNRFDDYRFGTVGRSAPGIEHRISTDGELHVRGSNVMQGYWRDAEATGSTIDADGWLATGDVGELDPDGFLRIVDRKKDLIVTSSGRNVAPTPLEIAMRGCPGVEHAMVFGDRRSRLVALLAVDSTSAAVGADGNPSRGHAVEIARAIAQLNSAQPPYRRIFRFAFVPTPTIADGLLTPSAKERRSRVGERYGELLEELWSGGGWDPETASRLGDSIGEKIFSVGPDG